MEAASQQRGLVETAGKHVDVSEVPGGRPVEQREELVAGEFFRGECRTGCRLGRGEVWRRVHGQVDYDCAVTVPDDQPTERAAVMDPLGAPPPPPGCSRQSVAGCRDVSRREFTRPRPYRLEDLARAAGMSISGVRTSYDDDEVAEVTRLTGARPARRPPEAQ